MIINMNKKFIVLPLAAAIFVAGFGTAGAQTFGPRVALQFGTNGLTNPLVASSSDAVIARLLLDTTGSTEAVRINSLPFNLVTSNGALASSLQNCRVFNESDLNTALNTTSTSTTLFTGVNNIALTNSLILQPNTLTTLSLRCDVNSTLVAGGTYTVNMNTDNVVATGASTGIPAAVTIRGSVIIPPVVTPPPATPGLPATGAGAEAAQNIAMLLASLLIAGLAFSTLGFRKKAN
ncbi:MAG: hypothetical protein A2758_00080 [Candidatus Zambryskibacteria bacterium RIFCSPHIGHO2_01_FULL_49_18]|uniref:Gram-positive cocci surface proteins LPxTG domain-containing protein n=1 Tax=Candidatus Zambryskibacteria bacterium RIFCSPHIGHO2_01_FULL_49_18 TaxID=1802740 RepID=A0A1G2T2J3_9BACT|nr:MAG: hypothetical protein A2758_00080 [Candidatus Zambryskibacteria bacterium RIFCSPHIGHO2_01_FULL_49_18]